MNILRSFKRDCLVCNRLSIISEVWTMARGSQKEMLPVPLIACYCPKCGKKIEGKGGDQTRHFR